jgi:hypothetical protein
MKSSVVKGIYAGFIATIALSVLMVLKSMLGMLPKMIVAAIPMAGAGLFGLHIGPAASIATLVLHWVYGAVLGAVYGRLTTSNLIGTHSHA